MIEGSFNDSNHMTNTHILLQEFDYYEPASLAEAHRLLDELGDSARVIAGGTHLLVMMKMERDAPRAVVSLSKISALSTIQQGPDSELRIGASATIRTVRDNPYIKKYYPALSMACRAFGNTQIEAMGTIGGNLCNGSPASDTIPALIAYGAVLIITSTKGERRMPVDEFFKGPGVTNLESGEILSTIVLPKQAENTFADYMKVSRIAADLAKVNMGVTIQRLGDQITACRIGIGSVAPTPLRLKRVEEALVGKTFSPALVEEAGRIASEDISPIDDARSTSWYRKQITSVMVRDLINRVWETAGQAKESVGEPDGFKPVVQPVGEHTSQKFEQGGRYPIEITVNGEKRKLWVATNELLINVLRERLDLTGTKYGCGIGECGACTVHINGQPALSCLTLALDADGKEVTTVEGLQGTDGELDPLQQAFIDEAAFQCGYCTPGILMTLKALLNENPNPDEEEIRDTLKGNRCRCTGYTAIVRAVFAATHDTMEKV